MPAAIGASRAAAARFNPARRGQSESGWTQLLGAAEEWVPERRALVVVSPHPDDEVLGAGGLMSQWSARGGPVLVVSVTDGEAAYPDWPHLDRCRRRELDRALSVLGGGTIRIVRLSLPDGAIAAHLPELERAIARVCDSRVTLVAPYENDGHPDHESAGQACRRVARERGVPVVRYPIWAWHHARPEDFSGMRFGRVRLDAATRAAKNAAIRCFTSQLAPGEARAPIVPGHVLRYFQRDFETFLV